MSSEIPTSPWPEKKSRQKGVGEGFELGLTLGSAYNFAKGYIYNDPSMASRFRSGLRHVRVNCLRTSGAVAGFFLVGDVVDTALLYYRQKDDPITLAASCAVTAAIFTARRGPLVSSCSVLGYSASGAFLHYYANKLEAEDKIRKNQIHTPKL